MPDSLKGCVGGQEEWNSTKTLSKGKVWQISVRALEVAGAVPRRTPRRSSLPCKSTVSLITSPGGPAGRPSMAEGFGLLAAQSACMTSL